MFREHDYFFYFSPRRHRAFIAWSAGMPDQNEGGLITQTTTVSVFPGFVQLWGSEEL